MPTVSATLLLWATIALSPAFANENTAAQTLCTKIEMVTDILADFTSTTCRSAPDTGGVALTILSQKAIFDQPDHKQVWLMHVAAAVLLLGKEYPEVTISKLTVSDTALMAQQRGFLMSLPVLQDLYGKIQSDQIDEKAFYAALLATLQPDPPAAHPTPQKK